LISIHTCCTSGGILCAPENAIDFEHGTLRVRTNLVRAGRQPVFGEPKTRTGYRSILLSPQALDAVKVAVLWKKTRRLKMGPKFRDAGTLFCTERGRPLDRRVLRARDHLPRLRRLKLPDSRIYDLRHLNITYEIAGGADLRAVADRAGHKDPGYLIRRYAHAVTAAQERAAGISSNLVAKSGLISR
jgi:integrase